MTSEPGPHRRRRRRMLRIGAIGALLGLFRPARRAYAANGDPMIVGEANEATQTTALVGDDPFAALHLWNKATRGLALEAIGDAGGAGATANGGSNAGSGPGGIGLLTFGGNHVLGESGVGLKATGGDSVTNVGGYGGEIFGFESSAGPCGDGVVAVGGFSSSGFGGHGARARGQDAVSGEAGAGVIATGGDSGHPDGTPAAGVVAYGGMSSSQPAPHPGGFGVVAGQGAAGTTDSASEPGLRGENTGKGPGVVGDGLSPGVGPGVGGHSQNAPGGYFQSQGIWGAIGLSTGGPGVQGFSQTKQGIAGTAPAATGLIASSVDDLGVRGTSSSGTGGYPHTTGAKDQFAAHANNIKAAGGPVDDAPIGVLVDGDWIVQNGIKSAAVPTSKGLTLLYAVEGPVAMFEDVGTVPLVGGRARVELDPLFLETIETGEYFVFASPRGETAGVYVAGQDARGFELREQQGGSSNVEVSYRVVARRKGLPAGHRLAQLRPIGAPTLELRRTPPPSGLPFPPVAVPPPPARPAADARPKRPAPEGLTRGR
jgi:hypothetical protein